MGGLDIHHLEADDIDKAFVLARLGYHDLPIANWRKMAAAAILVRWWEDPGQLGTVLDDGLLGLIGQLKAKLLQEVSS